MTELDEAKLAALTDIAAHLAEHGPQNWAITREKYPDIPERTWWRLVDAVKSGIPATEIMASAVKKAKRAAAKDLPAVVSPEYFAKNGVQAVENVDFLAQFGELFADAKLLKSWASTEKQDGTPGIKNPMFFAMSIKLRRDLMETAVKVMREVYDMQHSQDTWNAIIEEIAMESPAVAKRIMERLAVLNSQRGMTVNTRNS